MNCCNRVAVVYDPVQTWCYFFSAKALADHPRVKRLYDNKYQIFVFINRIDVICITGISVAYGYDQNIDRLGGGTSVTDSVLMERAIEKIKVQKTPFFYQLITGTSHKPYNEPYRKTKLSGATEFPEEVRNYMEVIHYTDRCIGAFVDSLRSNGLYDNTVIAIASDHNQLLSPCGVPGYNDTEAAFIVANADVKYTHTSVMGQIDIYPTLLDVMNCNDYAWKGLGYSILRTPVGSAAGWNGTVYGNEGDSLASRQIEAWDISEKIITKGYFSIK